MNFSLTERLQLLLALTLALTTTVIGMAAAALVLGRLLTVRRAAGPQPAGGGAGTRPSRSSSRSVARPSSSAQKRSENAAYLSA